MYVHIGKNICIDSNKIVCILNLETIKNTNSEFKTYKETEGRISKEYIWVYPPGIPLITPGEVISKELIKRIEEFRKANIEIRTTFSKFPKIEVIK